MPMVPVVNEIIAQKSKDRFDGSRRQKNIALHYINDEKQQVFKQAMLYQLHALGDVRRDNAASYHGVVQGASAAHAPNFCLATISCFYLGRFLVGQKM